MTGARELDCYGDEYKDLVSGVTDKIEAIADVQCQTRYDHVISEAEAEIADAEKKSATGAKNWKMPKRNLMTVIRNWKMPERNLRKDSVNLKIMHS